MPYVPVYCCLGIGPSLGDFLSGVCCWRLLNWADISSHILKMHSGWISHILVSICCRFSGLFGCESSPTVGERPWVEFTHVWGWYWKHVLSSWLKICRGFVPMHRQTCLCGFWGWFHSVLDEIWVCMAVHIMQSNALHLVADIYSSFYGCMSMHVDAYGCILMYMGCKTPWILFEIIPIWFYWLDVDACQCMQCVDPP